MSCFLTLPRAYKRKCDVFKKGNICLYYVKRNYRSRYRKLMLQMNLFYFKIYFDVYITTVGQWHANFWKKNLRVTEWVWIKCFDMALFTLKLNYCLLTANNIIKHKHTLQSVIIVHLSSSKYHLHAEKHIVKHCLLH